MNGDDMVRVVVFPERERIEVQERPRAFSPLEENEVEGETLVSLISPGTEINLQLLGERFPSEPGYAAVFRVSAVGEGVKELSVGDIALCSGPAGVGGHRSWQRCPAAMTAKVPGGVDGLDPAAAAHARLAAVSMATLCTTPVAPPGPVLITGLGPVGHLAAQVFRGCGYRVTGVDPIEQRRKLLQGKGFEDVYAEAPPRGNVPGGGYRLAVECSGHPRATLACVQRIRPGGEVVQLGVPHGNRPDPSAAELMEAVYRSKGTYRSGWEWQLPRTDAEAGPRDPGTAIGSLRTAVDWLAEGRLDVGGLYEVADPEDASAVYQRLRQEPYEAFSIAFDWRSSERVALTSGV